MLELSLANIAASGVADDVVVVVPKSSLGLASDLVGAGVRVVAGGESRRESVAAGLSTLADTEFVMVHDAARALTPPEVFQRVKAALTQGSQAVVPVVAVADTLKRVGAGGVVKETVDRRGLYCVQTPQGFRFDVLSQAHSAAPTELAITDDASMAEWCGVEVSTVAGSTEAFKITEPGDMALARAIINSHETK